MNIIYEDHDQGYYDHQEYFDELEEYWLDAVIDAFFEKHPPRIERFRFNEKHSLRVQFSLLEGIWIEHQEKISDISCYSDEVTGTHELKDAIKETRAWMVKHFFKYRKKRREVIEFLKKHWDYYVKSRKQERPPKNTFDGRVDKKLHDILETGFDNVDKCKIKWFFQDVKWLNRRLLPMKWLFTIKNRQTRLF